MNIQNSHGQFCVEVDNEYLTNITCIFLHVFNILCIMTVQCFEIMSDKCKIVVTMLVEIMKSWISKWYSYQYMDLVALPYTYSELSEGK
jgi:hypothetical protein